MSNTNNNPGLIINSSDDDNIGFGSWNLSDKTNESKPMRQTVAKRSTASSDKAGNSAFTAEIDVSQLQKQHHSNGTAHAEAPKSKYSEPTAKKAEEVTPQPVESNVDKESETEMEKTAEIPTVDPNLNDDTDDKKNDQEDSGKKKSKLPLLIIILLLILALLLLALFFLHRANGANAGSGTSTADNTKSTLEVTTPEITYDPNADPIDATTLVNFDANSDQLTASPETVDPGKVGTQKIKYTITKDGKKSETTQIFKVEDKTAPVIKFKSTSVTIKVGESFEPSSNIESVKDDLDGTLQVNNLSTDAGYTITSNVDNNKSGTYSVAVNARDNANNTSDLKYTVYVKDNSNNAEKNKTIQQQSNANVAENNRRKATNSQRRQSTSQENTDSRAANAPTKSIQGLTGGNNSDATHPSFNSTPTPSTRKTVWACTSDGETFNSQSEAANHAAQTGHRITSFSTNN